MLREIWKVKKIFLILFKNTRNSGAEVKWLKSRNEIYDAECSRFWFERKPSDTQDSTDDYIEAI